MQQSSDLRILITHSARENALTLGLVLAYVVIAIVLAGHFGFELRMTPWPYPLLFVACYLVMGVGGLLWMIAKERPERPLPVLIERVRRLRLKERLVIAAPVLFGMAIFFPAFSSMKSGIPVMSAYALDPLFARMDVWIHGRHAWEALHPLIGYPVVTYALNGLYHLWLLAFYVAVCAAAALVDQLELRRRFFITFVLCWVLLGNLGATLLASVGPCFYSAFYPDDPYAGLMSYLREADKTFPLAVLDVQEKLINWSREGETGVGRGISAMPSMHVSIACLLMLFSWKLGRFWGWAGTLFLIGIVLGSIQLAYHYAVDAYASLIATPLIWWAAKRLAAFKGFANTKLAPSAAYKPAE